MDADKYMVDVWEERDRLVITLHDIESGKTWTWADEDAREMFDDGFFKSGRDLEASVVAYAKEMELI
jgi:hypothetical protein